MMHARLYMSTRVSSSGFLVVPAKETEAWDIEQDTAMTWGASSGNPNRWG